MFVHGLSTGESRSVRWPRRGSGQARCAWASRMPASRQLSMWMSNTATTAMMFPLGLAVLAELGRDRRHDQAFHRYALAMMLMTSFAASIGGMGTPVGTPPNLIGIGLLRDLAGANISFAAWMALAIPLVTVTMGVLVVTLLAPAARHITLGTDTVKTVRQALDQLGPMGRGNGMLTGAFTLTMGLWMPPGLLQAVLGQTHPVVQRINQLLPEAAGRLLLGPCCCLSCRFSGVPGGSR